MWDRVVRDGASRNTTVTLCLLLMTAVAVYLVTAGSNPVSMVGGAVCLVLLSAGAILQWRVWLEDRGPVRLGAGGELLRGTAALLLLAALPVLEAWGRLRGWPGLCRMMGLYGLTPCCCGFSPALPWCWAEVAGRRATLEHRRLPTPRRSVPLPLPRLPHDLPCLLFGAGLSWGTIRDATVVVTKSRPRASTARAWVGQAGAAPYGSVTVLSGGAGPASGLPLLEDPGQVVS